MHGASAASYTPSPNPDYSTLVSHDALLLLRAFGVTVGGHPLSDRRNIHLQDTGTSPHHIQLLLSIVTALTATVHLAPGN